MKSQRTQANTFAAQSNTTVMKKTVLTFGAIASVILAIMMSISVGMMKANKGPVSGSMFFGYLSMLIAFAFIFVAIKSYRDRYSSGVISFGKGFQVGLWITLVASVAYTLTWVILYKGFYPEFMTDYTAHSLEQMRAAGKTAAEIQKANAEAQDMQAVYSTWPGLIGFTLLEILPVGLLISLIAALILKRRAARDDRGSKTAMA